MTSRDPKAAVRQYGRISEMRVRLWCAVFDVQKRSEQVRWSGALVRLCGHVVSRDDVIPTSCVLAVIALCLHLVASHSCHLSPALLHVTGMVGAVRSLQSHAAAFDDRGGAVDVAALDSWYRRHMTFEIVNLAGALQFFAHGQRVIQWQMFTSVVLYHSGFLRTYRCCEISPYCTQLVIALSKDPYDCGP